MQWSGTKTIIAGLGMRLMLHVNIITPLVDATLTASLLSDRLPPVIII